MGWTVVTVSAVDSEIEALPVKLRARLFRPLEAVENVGLEALREPHVKHLQGKLWKLRVRAEGEIVRGIYVTAAERRLVVLHVFVKKSRRTPRRALETARKRAKRERDCPLFVSPLSGGLLKPVRHQITFRRLTLHPAVATLRTATPQSGLVWADPGGDRSLPIPSYVAKIVRLYRRNHDG